MTKNMVLLEELISNQLPILSILIFLKQKKIMYTELEELLEPEKPELLFLLWRHKMNSRSKLCHDIKNQWYVNSN